MHRVADSLRFMHRVADLLSLGHRVADLLSFMQLRLKRQKVGVPTHL